MSERNCKKLTRNFIQKLICSAFASFAKTGLKGQKAPSPGHRPGYKEVGKTALKEQKHTYRPDAFALAGRRQRTTFTQGDALGWGLVGLSGRCYVLLS
ncbi:MAG: hypothetical protein IJ841_05945 [Prevotella sp.]|nr:hypothetical protein [Prevotella sp.]